jgi:hypothetical protein
MLQCEGGYGLWAMGYSLWLIRLTQQPGKEALPMAHSQ